MRQLSVSRLVNADKPPLLDCVCIVLPRALTPSAQPARRIGAGKRNPPYCIIAPRIGLIAAPILSLPPSWDSRCRARRADWSRRRNPPYLLSAHRSHCRLLQFNLLVGGGCEPATDRLVGPPTSISRHARLPQRFRFREDEPTPVGQGALRKQKPFHPLRPHEPGPIQKTFPRVRPSRNYGDSAFNSQNRRSRCGELSRSNPPLTSSAKAADYASG